MTASEIAARVDEILAALRERFGELPSAKMVGCVYAGDDDRWVATQPMTPYEMYEVDKALFGQEIADWNYEHPYTTGDFLRDEQQRI